MKQLSKSAIAALALVSLTLPLVSVVHAETYVTIATGLPGEARFEEIFSSQQEQILAASSMVTAESNIQVFSASQTSRAALTEHLQQLATVMNDDDRAQIYLLGHGSFDGEHYKFNIPGPDITGQEISELLANLPGQNHVLVSTTSASGALLDIIDSDRLVIVTATRNGNEKNAPQFGSYFFSAFGDETADLNKNNSISVQEAFELASRQVEDFYSEAGRLATEHPQLKGENADRLIIARLDGAMNIDASDPEMQSLLEQQAAIDSRIEDLQLRRQEFSNDDYIEQLQNLILEAALITEEIERLESQNVADSPD